MQIPSQREEVNFWADPLFLGQDGFFRQSRSKKASYLLSISYAWFENLDCLLFLGVAA